MIKALGNADDRRAADLLTPDRIQAAVTIAADRNDEASAHLQQPTTASAAPGTDSVPNGMNNVQQAAQRVTDASNGPTASVTDVKISGGPGYAPSKLVPCLT